MIGLIAHPSQAPVLRALARLYPDTAVCCLWRGAFPGVGLPVFRTLPDLLATHAPGALCVLQPYPRLTAQLVNCLDQGIRVLSAGPSEGLPTPRWQWGNQHLYSPLVLQALAQRRSAAFGEPVYLRRMVGGGTGLLPAWWAACQVLAEAWELLGPDPTWAQVAARRAGRSVHVVVSLSFANGANAHLSVAPCYFSPSADLTLLGSGGLVFSETAGNTPVVVRSVGAELHPPPYLFAETAWISAFLADELPPLAPALAGLQMKLLPALRRSLHTSGPEQLV